VPIPNAGVEREIVLAAHDHQQPRTLQCRAWELSRGILYCACGRRMATHTANRGDEHDYYYVCGLRRSNRAMCEHLRYHPAAETEERVREPVRRLLSRPKEVRRRAGTAREVKGWERRLSTVERRRSVLIDMAADGTITRDDLRAKLAELDVERERASEELEQLRDDRHWLDNLGDLPELAEAFARDLPYLLSLPIYKAEPPHEGPLSPEPVTPQTISPPRERDLEAEAAQWPRAYEDLGIRFVAHKDGILEATWRFSDETLRSVNGTSKNKHATKHFHSSGHPIIQSFEPGEDWRWCYVDEVLVPFIRRARPGTPRCPSRRSSPRPRTRSAGTRGGLPSASRPCAGRRT
jgi:hypothetical protein